jgi:hypothetical protein
MGWVSSGVAPREPSDNVHSEGVSVHPDGGLIRWDWYALRLADTVPKPGQWTYSYGKEIQASG